MEFNLSKIVKAVADLVLFCWREGRAYIWLSHRFVVECLLVCIQTKYNWAHWMRAGTTKSSTSLGRKDDKSDKML